MANETIYPFGINGSLPSGYPIVADLVTNRSDKALAASQGVALEDKIFRMNSSPIDLSQFSELMNWYINASGKWVNGTGDAWGCKLVPVVVGQRYRVYGATTIALLQSNTMTDGADADFCTGYEGRIGILEGALYDFIAPADMEYLYVLTTASGTPKDFSVRTSDADYLSSVPGKNAVSGLVEMMHGVVASDGNLYAVVGTITDSIIGQKYGNGFVSVGLVRVRPGDVLEISYTKMGVDSAVWKIGVEELGEDGRTFEINGASTATIQYYLTDTDVTIHERTRYIRLVLFLRDTSSYTLHGNFSLPVSFKSYSEPELAVCKDFVTNKKDAALTYPVRKRFSYAVEKTDIAFDVAETLDYQTPSWGFNNGYVLLPEEYNPNGKPLPLIIFCHGTGGMVFENAYSATEDLIMNVAEGGWAVAGCSALSSFYYDNDMGTSMTVRDANYPDPMSWECYNKLYQYLVTRFNIDKERVYIVGKSAGGLNVILLSQMGVIPIKAAAGLAGSIDLISLMRVVAYASTTTNPFLHRIGLTDANVSDKLQGSGDSAYLVNHIRELLGFNPLWYRAFGIDRETQTERTIADALDTPTIEADTELQASIEDAAVFLRIPMKWWHAVDDENVPIAYTRMFQKMVRNGGGVFEIREFPADCGQHHAVDNAVNAPTTTYTHRNGKTVTLPVAYAEFLDWFRMWWD